MASKTDAILLRIGADVSGATKGIGDLSKQVGGLTSKVEEGANGLLKFAGIVGAGLAIKGAIANALEFGDAMTKLSQQTGMSTDAVQRLDFIASQTGTTIEAIAGAVGKMQKTLVESADGGKKLGESLGYTHDQVVKLLGMSPDQQFTEIAKSIAAMTNPAEQTAAAMAAFGKSGAELLPTLKEVGTQADALSAQFDAIGGPVSADTIKALDDIGDAGSRVSSSVRSFASELLALAAPAILGAMDGITQFFGGLRVLIGAGSNEMVNLDDEIGKLSQSIQEAEDGLTGFGGGTSAEELAAMKAHLEELRAEYQKLADAPMVAAQAARAAHQANLALQAEELADLVVHGDAKKKIVIDQELKLMEDWNKLHEGWNGQLEQMAQDHNDRLLEIDTAGLQARVDLGINMTRHQVEGALGELEGLTAGVAQQNKVMFNINKAAAIANATISTYEGVAKSLSAYPMPLAGIMAAIHLAAGISRVQAIASTNYNGGGKGPAPSQGGQPATPTVPTGGQSAGGGGGGANSGQTLRVEGLQAGQFYSSGMVRELAGRLLEYQKDGGTVVLAQ